MTRALPPGTELCCTTCLGDELRGNVIATDYHLKAVVLRILGINEKYLFPYIHIYVCMYQVQNSFYTCIILCIYMHKKLLL